MKPIVVFYINVSDHSPVHSREIISEIHNHLIPEEFRKEYWVFILPVQYQESRVELLHAKGSEQLDIEKLDEMVRNFIKTPQTND